MDPNAIAAALRAQVAFVDFDEATHTYSTGDRIYPSVTKIIVETGVTSVDGVPPSALERGARVHQMVAAIGDPENAWPTMPAEEQIYARRFLEFTAATGFMPFLCEQRVLIPVQLPTIDGGFETFWVAGTLDALGLFERDIPEFGIQAGQIGLPDFKSGMAGVPAWVRFQLAGYGLGVCFALQRAGLTLNKPLVRFGVGLKPHQPFSFNSVTDFRVCDSVADVFYFCSLVAAYHAQRGRNFYRPSEVIFSIGGKPVLVH